MKQFMVLVMAVAVTVLVLLNVHIIRYKGGVSEGLDKLKKKFEQ